MQKNKTSLAFPFTFTMSEVTKGTIPTPHKYAAQTKKGGNAPVYLKLVVRIGNGNDLL